MTFDLETRDLGLKLDTGFVYLKVGDGDDDDPFIGMIDLIDLDTAVMFGVLRQWLWLREEAKDRRRLADGIRHAAHDAFEDGHSPETWT